MLTRPAIASSAWRQMRSSALAMPAVPSLTGQVMSIVSAANTSWETWRSVSSARLSRIGWSRISLWACSGVSSNRLRSEPRLVARLITISSRVESMGGLVTCANSCLKYENRGGACSENTARERSLPIEPTGSCASRAIGASSTRRSSCV